MKKLLHPLLIVTALFLHSITDVKGQYALLEADKAYKSFNFVKAIDLYEQAYQKKATLHAAQRLTTCYSLRNDYKQTESWAAIAVGMEKSTADDVLNYAKALQANSKFGEAKVQYQKYANLKPDVNPELQKVWLQSCDSATVWTNHPRIFSIKNEAELNSPYSDWGAMYENNSIVFASDRGTHDQEIKTKKPFLKFDGSNIPNSGIYTWTGTNYLKIFIKRGKDSVKYYPIHAGTDFHVGPASFTAANDEAYFTVTRLTEQLDYHRDADLKGKLGTIRVEIFSLTKDTTTGIWSTKPIAFPYNNIKSYSLTDPFISADGQHLYFASNMAGGKGGLDLYVSHRNSDKSWGQPVHLGDVNTAGNERTPSIGANGKFYFSTNGRVGMGGLDIFRAKINGDLITNMENLQYPINSPQDDFSFYLQAENEGYLSSNRFGGMGSDDIYSFKELVNLKLLVSGTVYDNTTKQPLKNAIVSLGKPGHSDIKVQTDSEGKYQFKLADETNYTLNGEKTDYRSEQKNISTIGLKADQVIKQDLFLTPIVLDQAIRLENIYYDFDKSNIRADAALELNKLVKIMQDNPTIWIELSSHTDSRGNDAYNQALSQRRAEAAVQYIISRGINKNRITAKGYGESKLLNNCGNGKICSAEEHQFNRRTEFKIVKQ